MIIVKVPGINGLGKTNGCEKAGDAVLKAFEKEIYSNEQGKPIDARLFDFKEISLDNSNIDTANSLIYKNSLEVFGRGQRSVFLGGDHSVSYSIIRAFFNHVRSSESMREPCLIVFDAHPDCMPLSSDKRGRSPTHEEWLRALIEEGFPAENLLLVGVRNSYSEETIFLKKHNIRTISINSLLEDLRDVCDAIMEFSNRKELYVSIDIDVIDPAFAPATGYLEPGGLTSREFLYLIQRINKIKNLRALDIVEINPDKEKNNLTVKLGAKILSELI